MTEPLSKHADQPVPRNGKHPPYITTTRGGSGDFSVLLWWNPDMGGFYEPWDTGVGRYATREEAEVWAKQWAEAEGLEYRPASGNATLSKTSLNPAAAWPFPKGRP